MTTETIALARREYSDNQIKSRIKLNQQAGYGLEKANPAQLNIIYFLCQRYDLDPVSDVTLFQGRPFITIDGRLRLLRRHPEYRGYTCRPLGKDEKDAWGYEPEDVVVECTIRTTTWGEISARGKFNKKEIQPVGKMHPVELAEKRAIARAERAAFGQEAVIDDEEAEAVARTIVEERSDPVRNAELAAEYQRIVTDDYYDLPEDNQAAEPVTSATGSATDSNNSPSGESVAQPTKADLWQEHRRLQNKARELGVVTSTLANRAGEDEIEAANQKLREQISEKEAAF